MKNKAFLATILALLMLPAGVSSQTSVNDWEEQRERAESWRTVMIGTWQQISSTYMEYGRDTGGVHPIATNLDIGSFVSSIKDNWARDEFVEFQTDQIGRGFYGYGDAPFVWDAIPIQVFDPAGNSGEDRVYSEDTFILSIATPNETTRHYAAIITADLVQVQSVTLSRDLVRVHTKLLGRMPPAE